MKTEHLTKEHRNIIRSVYKNCPEGSHGHTLIRAVNQIDDLEKELNWIDEPLTEEEKETFNSVSEKDPLWE